MIKNTTITYNQDGVITSIEEERTIQVGKEPSYYKVYLQDIAMVFGLSPSEQKVFEVLCANMGFGNRVVLIKAVKNKMTELTGYSYDTIRKAIQVLTQKKILISEDRACYIVNPNYAARGEWADIKAMRIVIDYSERGRNIEVQKLTKKTIIIKESAVRQLNQEDAPDNGE